jgi:hypothetical protein
MSCAAHWRRYCTSRSLPLLLSPSLSADIPHARGTQSAPPLDAAEGVTRAGPHAVLQARRPAAWARPSSGPALLRRVGPDRPAGLRADAAWREASLTRNDDSRRP